MEKTLTKNNIIENAEEFEKSPTFRPCSPAIEEILQKKIPLLDHGFIRVIDYMGDDNAIVQAARVSYGKGTKKTSQDRGLIQYLMRHYHTTPFEMCDIKFHVKLPIFVARQWIRHRTASVNEYSARYSILAKEFYIPEAGQLEAQSLTNRQGREGAISPEEARRIQSLLIMDAENCYSNYLDMLNEDDKGNIINESKSPLSRELARMNLTLNYYTEWYWKINLHNLLHFVRLRSDSHAQYEIRVYADAILDIIKKWVPLTYEAFMEYRVNGCSLSGNALAVVKQMLKGNNVTFQDSKMSKREWDEFCDIMELSNI